MDQREIILCNPVRTAIGTFDGSLVLGATVVRAILRLSRLKGPDVWMQP
ncbi:MAG: hypothetical protein WBX25_01330 [Rhodomicrobium sp.]